MPPGARATAGSTSRAWMAAAALALSTGCHEGIWAAGGGWAGDWSAPVPIAEPGGCAGIDVAVTTFMQNGIGPTYGLCHYSRGDEDLTVAYLTYDLGFLCGELIDQALGPDRSVPVMPIIKPLVGVHHWSESLDGAGLVTGCKVGILWGPERWGEYVLASLEYGWLTLHDTVGERETRLNTITVAVVILIVLDD